MQHADTHKDSVYTWNNEFELAQAARTAPELGLTL